jgi:hypothetical protein
VDLRAYARDKPCMLRIPGVCNGNKATTVLCHIKRGWAGSPKPPDLCAVWGCCDCHDAIDGRRQFDGYTRVALDALILRALCQQLAEYAHLGVVTW